MTDDDKKRPVRSYISEIARGKRSIHVTVRMSLDERKRFREKARQAGLNLSSFIRHLLTTDPVRKKKTADNDSGPPSSSGTVK